VNVLVIDVGGTKVKFLASGQTGARRFESGQGLTPADMVARVKEATADWAYEVVSVGVPAVVADHGAQEEPGNLGAGWVGFDFEAAFGKPVRVVNDAAMQALGAYTGGRMLFLGLGTGLGSALVVERVIVPLELGNLPFRRRTMGHYLGKTGLRESGMKTWVRAVTEITTALRRAFATDYVVLGGGNAKLVEPLPDGARYGGNVDAFTGGFRLWEETVEPHDRPASSAWRVVR
jgi:polyphosphate glucokinase